MSKLRERPNRSGEVPLDQMVNEGKTDLLLYTPEDSDGVDMVTAINRQKRRQSDNPNISTDRNYVQPVNLPDYVVCNQIELEGYKWVYSTPTYPVENIRRVFIERNQLIELDIDSSLQWLSASYGTPKHEEVRKHLEQESNIDNVNNQIILQLMYNRVEHGLPILDTTNNKLYTGRSK